MNTGNSKKTRPDPGSSSSESDESGILNERILVLIFERVKWDLQLLCTTASLNRKLHAIAERLLWRHLCFHRAPRMLSSLTNNGARAGGGWHALAKLLFFCCGCQPSPHFRLPQTLPGHFVKESRFSKTSGRSFLPKRCRGDLLYVSDPCEHSKGCGDEDLGIYRGVFRGFMRSQTRALLVRREVRLDERLRCPYCGARVWSMTSARLVPKSAARRLGTHDGGLEYFVCVNGHLHGSCWLIPLSSEEDRPDDDDDDDDDEEEADDREHQNGLEDRTVTDESASSTGEEVVAE